MRTARIDGFDLPLDVNFGYATYKVEFLPGPLTDEEGSRVWGDTCFDTYTIRIDSHQPESAILECYVHELTHVLLEVCGLGEESTINIDNEALTLLLSRQILSLLRLNSPDQELPINFNLTKINTPGIIEG